MHPPGHPHHHHHGDHHHEHGGGFAPAAFGDPWGGAQDLSSYPPPGYAPPHWAGSPPPMQQWQAPMEGPPSYPPSQYAPQPQYAPWDPWSLGQAPAAPAQTGGWWAVLGGIGIGIAVAVLFIAPHREFRGTP